MLARFLIFQVISRLELERVICVCSRAGVLVQNARVIAIWCRSVSLALTKTASEEVIKNFPHVGEVTLSTLVG